MRVSRVGVRRSAALLVAAVVIGGTPLVARALDHEIAPAVSGDLESSRAQPERRPAEDERPATPATPAPEPDEAAAIAAAVAAAVDANRSPGVELADADVHGTVELVPVPTDTPPVVAFPPGPAGSEWEALRRCESNGDYSITNPSGKYRGAYQFDRPTWNSVAERHAPRLVDVDPAAASPADQDAMAYALYSERGPGPWPQCGRHLS